MRLRVASQCRGPGDSALTVSDHAVSSQDSGLCGRLCVWTVYTSDSSSYLDGSTYGNNGSGAGEAADPAETDWRSEVSEDQA